ncbi:hypothetical protein [Paenibacillus aestuarii]|uniref:PepSY domain-containing protein n=1 Tax=Paenibacillus aestuarii TaxID=516965 RepID=A0ABW0KB70_9BACL|nr:hypothetical protein [Paenibacillus aestuarii]
MKVWISIALVLAMTATGCAKKEGTSPAASPAPTASVQPSPGATATAGTTGGGTAGGTATASPGTGGGTTATANPEPPPNITKAQEEKLPATSTYDDLVKLTGSKGKLVNDSNGKKTYEYAISDQPGYYVDFVYFSDGKMSEKKVFKK